MAIKKEGTIGAAALLAVAAAFIGISVQTGSKSGENGMSDAALTKAATSNAKEIRLEYKRGCGSLRDQLKDFLGLKDQPFENWICPDPAHLDMARFPGETSGLHFAIALAPDPAHTHLSLLFDAIAVSVQEAAQDEKYDFDSSWLPWDDEKSSYALLEDQKIANKEKEAKETQPGIILFRNRCPSKNTKPGEYDDDPTQTFRQGLVVFVVGEEATGGIHRDQFRNATAWIAALHSIHDASKKVAILGPTFSGSLPSLQQLLADDSVKSVLGLPDSNANQLAIYSGSVSSKEAAEKFHKAFPQFHSFVQNDNEILFRFFNYMCTEQGGAARRIVILSEDETAYGGRGLGSTKFEPGAIANMASMPDSCRSALLNLFYPRDISALRDAYQRKLLTQSGSSPQSPDIRRNLPRDLADPGGRVRDSIRSYGGNQTPLAQEAVLMQILSELRDHRATYIVLRGTNALDQLFLADFLHRSYPDGRIVLFSSDLLFMRERGADSLGGMLALSTYPLVTHIHEWTANKAAPAADRVFSADAVEGVYVAFRVLLNDKHFNPDNGDVGCRVQENQEAKIFLPAIVCRRSDGYSPIPDYAPPFWISDPFSSEQEQSRDPKSEDVYSGPPIWLSVIGENRFWPVAALLHGEAQNKTGNDRRDEPELPLEMKVAFLVLVGFSLFHAWCCWSGSYTAKPAFRAHFAHEGDVRHRLLLFCGSSCVALTALIFGLGSGVFSHSSPTLLFPVLALCCMLVVLLAAWAAVLLNEYTALRLKLDCEAAEEARKRGQNERGGPKSERRKITWCDVFRDKRFFDREWKSSACYLATIAVLWLLIILPLESALSVENRELTYWRAMHLFSGLSPVIPVFALVAGLYLAFWFALHGLALFGLDRPLLPPLRTLHFSLGERVGNNGVEIEEKNRSQENEKKLPLLRMFSRQDAAKAIERAAIPLQTTNLLLGSGLGLVLFLAALILAGEVPIRNIGGWSYSIIFLAALDICGTLILICTWQLTNSWVKLKRLLTFLDRLTLRRTLAALHGFSWESVWKMSGNVLEVRYKIISRQIEAINHTLTALENVPELGLAGNSEGIRASCTALRATRDTGVQFAIWYSDNYRQDRAGDLSTFHKFQNSVATTTGTLITKLLIPAWRKEEQSLIADPYKQVEDKEGAQGKLPQAKDPHIRNAEELVCLTYLGFIQNALGRLRTLALTIVVLFLACTLAISSYPFDPRQGLSTVLVILFVIAGVVIIKVYAEMHRDSTLSHVTNTRPGELGSEFWFKIVAFGFAPLMGLMARIFPGAIDFIFFWIQPGISSLK
jgi:hypothetical protein